MIKQSAFKKADLTPLQGRIHRYDELVRVQNLNTNSQALIKKLSSSHRFPRPAPQAMFEAVQTKHHANPRLIPQLLI